MEASNAHELKDLIKHQPQVYRDVMHSHIDNYLETHPFLIVDDAESGKVIAVSVKGSPAREQSDEPTVNKNVCIRPFPPGKKIGEQYYLLIGDDSDFNVPLSKNGLFPQAVIMEYITRYQLDHNGISPPGTRLADVIRENLNDKLSDAYPSGKRPKNVEAVLISNPLPENMLSGEDYSARIHILQHEEDGDNVIMAQPLRNPAHFSSRGVIWDNYTDNLKALTGSSPKRRGRTKPMGLETKLTAAIAALITDQHIQAAGPSIIDALTVPFIPPAGNKSRARYDLEYIAPLYERALKLL